MKWDYCISLYIDTHCTARGLQPKTIAAYKATLEQFMEYMIEKNMKNEPEHVTTREILEYVQYLRTVRNNKDDAVNRAVTVIRMFYRALVAMEYLDVKENPMKKFPKI
jgi:site-specific recombinase XerD